MTNRHAHSTRFDRVFIDNDLTNDVIEVWINSERVKDFPAPKMIERTCYPDGTMKIIKERTEPIREQYKRFANITRQFTKTTFAYLFVKEEPKQLTIEQQLTEIH